MTARLMQGAVLGNLELTGIGLSHASLTTPHALSSDAVARDRILGEEAIPDIVSLYALGRVVPYSGQRRLPVSMPGRKAPAVRFINFDIFIEGSGSSRQ